MATAATTQPTVPEADPGVTLRDVDWATYRRLRDLEANNHVRMTYLDGTLTLMSPEYRHDFDARNLLYVVTAVARACRIEFQAAGTTTLRIKGQGRRKGAGKEPDEGFYLGDDAARIRDKRTIDLTVDPPPNLAIEVDNTVSSKRALATYARIRVPEVWRYDSRKRTLWFGRLAGETYENIPRSVVLPRLTPPLVLQALEARADGRRMLDWLDWLDAWARSLPEPPATA